MKPKLSTKENPESYKMVKAINGTAILQNPCAKILLLKSLP